MADTIRPPADAGNSVQTEPALTDEQGARLVRLARSALNAAVGALSVGTESDADLQLPGATFVTLTQAGQLRGCIGSLQAHRPLAEDVRNNAVAAALHDPRFEPVTAREAPTLRVEVSVLTPAQPLSYTDQAHALQQLQPGVDGVVLECVYRGRKHRSTFLPQVWEQLPDVATFMAHLKAKAGLAQDFWSPEVRLSVYRVQKFLE